jgi:hypothetical protein
MDALELPRILVWVGAALSALIGLSALRSWPQRLGGLRQPAQAHGLWALFYLASVEWGLHNNDGPVDPAGIVVMFGGVILTLVSIFLIGRSGGGKVALGWGALWLFVGLPMLAGLSLSARDLNLLSTPSAQIERTLAAFEADPEAVGSTLTDGVCRADSRVNWVERSGSKKDTTSHFSAVPLISAQWKTGQPIRTWILDGHKACPGEGAQRTAPVVLRDRPVPQEMRARLSEGVSVPPDALLVRIPDDIASLRTHVIIGLWGHVVLLALSMAWWLTGPVLLMQPETLTPRPLTAHWLHDGVVLDLGPRLSQRANVVRPLLYAGGTGLTVLIGGPLVLCAVGCLGEISELWVTQSPTFLAVTFGAVLPIGMVATAGLTLWHQRVHQELHISTRVVRLMQRRGQRRREIWVVPVHEIDTCAWHPGPSPTLQIKRMPDTGGVLSASTLTVQLPEPIENDVDLGELVSMTVASAKTARGHRWEIPPSLQDLLQDVGTADP